MKLLLIVFGKTEAGYLSDGIGVYLKRVRHYMPVEVKVIPAVQATRHTTPEIQKEREASLLIPMLQGKCDVFLLDEGGQTFTSRQFAGFIEKKMIAGCRELVFVVGGPYGFSETVEKSVTGKISLSQMTFSHQMVRLLFAEQLYRAFTIIRGEPYHND